MDIEKMSSIDISQENIKSISEKCHQLQELQKQYKEKEDELSKIKSKVRDLEERIIPEMMQEAGDAMAHMDPEVLQATLQGISSQMGIPVSQISKMMGGLIPQTPTPDTEDNSKDSD